MGGSLDIKLLVYTPPFSAQSMRRGQSQGAIHYVISLFIRLGTMVLGERVQPLCSQLLHPFLCHLRHQAHNYEIDHCIEQMSV